MKSIASVRSFWFACSVLTLAGSSLASPLFPSGDKPTVVAASPQLPDTAPARIASAWFAMINDPREAAVDAFETAFASKKRAGKATAAERRTRADDLHRQWGRATIQRVLHSDAHSIEVAVVLEKRGSAEVEFRLDPQEAGKLDGILIKSNGPEPRPITSAERTEAVTRACQLLEEQYVMPAAGKSMAEAVRKKHAAGEYDACADDAALASRLTEDLRAICHDKHLSVRASAREHAQGEERHDFGPRGLNQGFRKVEVLDGNIGYLKLDLFLNTDEAKAAATAAMTFLQNTDALVFDLRQNGGGDPEMIRFLTSWLFDEKTHLNDMLDREGKVVEEYWTLADIPGKRFAKDVPVYVLTSDFTFSGGEEFTYNLKNLKRATIIGETTGGGANPVSGERMSDRFVLNVPRMRAQNPITKTNWEGVGVTPDIAVPAEDALDRAIAEAHRVLDSRSEPRPAAK